MIFCGINKIERPPTVFQASFWSSDYDPSRGIIYTAANHDHRILILQLNITNGESINSKFEIPSVWDKFILNFNLVSWSQQCRNELTRNFLSHVLVLRDLSPSNIFFSTHLFF